jgi:hypothetical protein
MRSGSLSLEAALLLPVLLLVFGVTAQYFIFAHSRVYVQQAAYAAARSAIVHKCMPPNLLRMLDNPASAIGAASCTDNRKKWEDAARWHLVPASPAAVNAQARGQCPNLPAAESLMAGSQMSAELSAAFRARLCYAFEPENVQVTVLWEPGLASAASRNGRPAMRATVRFRYPITAPIGLFLSHGERADGTLWRWGEATVLLL